MQSSIRQLFVKHWIAIGLATIFTITFYWLNSQQYLTFQTRSPDADRFSQAMWHTLHGQFLYSTIKEGSILQNHFSPYMALLAPLFYIWQDVRIIYFVQVVGFALAGLLLYKITYHKRPTLAPWFLLAFYLNPPLHKVALFELRRITLAVPFLALVLYGLYTKKRHWLLIGIIFALLIKEEVGLLVSGVGIFLLLFERDWKWGGFLAVFGVVWTITAQLYIIPAMGNGAYPPIGYFDSWGSSLDEIAWNMITNPDKVLQTMFDQTSLTALWKLLLPVAFILPFMGVDYLLICLPLLAVMLLSSEPAMHTLDRWYLASILPFIFAAIAIGLSRVSLKWGGWLTGLLIMTTLISYYRYGNVPLGGNFEPWRYQFTGRDQTAWEIIDTIPDEAKVTAQSAFSIQLAHREQIYIYPWVSIPEDEIDYLILAEDFFSYPISHDIHWEILNTVANPNYIVEQEANGIFLFRYGGEPLPSIPVNRVADGTINLERFEIAVADERGFFQPATTQPLVLRPEQLVRVTLYWKALDAPNAERTVSVRITDASGALVAQKDQQPSEGSRPTSWWQPDWYFRDVYYLSVAAMSVPGNASLDLVLYDSLTLEKVFFDNGEEVLHLFPVQLVP